MMDEQPAQSLPNQPQTTPTVEPAASSTPRATPQTAPGSPDQSASGAIPRSTATPLTPPITPIKEEIPVPSTPIRIPQPPQISPDTVQLGEFKRQKFIKKARQIIIYFLTVLEILFALRFIFKLITANSTSSLVLWIFDISDVFINPFVGIMKNSGRGAHILEWTTLVAMGLYALLAVILIGLVKLFAPTAPQKVWEE